MPPPQYATAADFEGYVPGWTTTDAAALDALLQRATRDVDSVLGPLPLLYSGNYAGLKLDPTELDPLLAAALSRATCAQAEHRFRYVEPLTAKATAAGGLVATGIKGPDFEETYGGPDPATGAGRRIGPQVAVELEPLAAYRRPHVRARP